MKPHRAIQETVREMVVPRVVVRAVAVLWVDMVVPVVEKRRTKG